MSDPREYIEEIVETLMGCMRAMSDMATSNSPELSPKQKADAAKATSVLAGQILDRVMPRMTAQQTTNLNYDVTKVVAKVLTPDQLRQMQNMLGMRKELQAIDVEATAVDTPTERASLPDSEPGDSGAGTPGTPEDPA